MSDDFVTREEYEKLKELVLQIKGGDPDTPPSTSIEALQNHIYNSGMSFWSGTQEEYQKLPETDRMNPNYIFLIRN